MIKGGDPMKSLLEEYMNKIKIMDEREYLFGVILYSIAPTLAGHKPSSIITLSGDNGNLYSLWEKYGGSFWPDRSTDFYELKRTNDVISLLFYSKEKLVEVIYESKNLMFLYKLGYRADFSLEENLEVLKLRFEQECPHEIGIFLGIPLEDVISFIESPNQECLLSGYWKVYSNADYARQQFLNYDNDKNNIIRDVLQGIQPSLVMRG